MKKNIWIIGSGEMALEYAKVLKDLNETFIVIGRSINNCNKIQDKFGIECIAGGLTLFLASNPELPNKVINTVGIEALSETTIELINYGVKNILLEKPGVAYPQEIYKLAQIASNQQATVLLAYNRRFYASVLAVEVMIKEDGGVSSFNFEFTEWSHIIGKLKKTKEEWHNWFLGNSTHIIDTAFYLCGSPSEISCYHLGKDNLHWHPAAANFAGAGVTTQGALFSYHANWEAPGRWVIEILTKKRRFIFKPIERLQVQQLGSVAVEFVDIDDKLDKAYKPGLFLQTKAFISGDYTRFADVQEQKRMIDHFYLKMSGY